jgi:hypothetical protein
VILDDLETIWNCNLLNIKKNIFYCFRSFWSISIKINILKIKKIYFNILPNNKELFWKSIDYMLYKQYHDCSIQYYIY